MTLELSTPSTHGLDEAVAALAAWQQDELPVQIHPGDLGWNAQFGADAVAAMTRIWRLDGRIVATGFVDDGVLRLGISPEVGDDEQVASALSADLTDPDRGVLPSGPATVEARYGPALRARLIAQGWSDDEEWTELTRSLAEPIEQVGVQLEVVANDDPDTWIATHHAVWGNQRVTPTMWQAVIASPAAGARLLARDASGEPVGNAAVWSAGSGRPGLIEPLGVAPAHRGRGYGVALTLGCARQLQRMGSSSVRIATTSSNVAAVATYLAAGFTATPHHDLRRPE